MDLQRPTQHLHYKSGDPWASRSGASPGGIRSRIFAFGFKRPGGAEVWFGDAPLALNGFSDRE